LAPRYIKWPSQLERQRIAEIIERRTRYRGIVGAIDGTLITTRKILTAGNHKFDIKRTQFRNYSL
jgi:hypothetical protein